MSTVAKKIMMGSGAVAGSYEIEQSLNFNWGDDSALKRTPSTTSNRRTWTTSMWIKRLANTITGGTDHTYGVAWGSDDGEGYFFTQILFTATGQLEFNSYHYNLGATFKLTTNRVFRDCSAWFHLVFALDTTQGTAANRMKMYINGVQETSFSARTDPAQNRDSWVNYSGHPAGGSPALAMVIGNGYLSNAGNVNYQTSFGMAEHNFIDGAALAPSSFGETNPDTGQWIPKKYGGSYGTNGYYLKLVSGAIGTDSSGEGNNMSLISVVNSDVVIDSPTNNFATMNPLPSLSSALVLSEGNLKGAFRGTGVANGYNAVSTLAMPVGSGKWYFEMRNTYQGNGFILGIQPKSEDYGLIHANSFGYYYATNGTKAYNGYFNETSYGTAWFTSGQTYIISCYYDSDLGKIGFYMNGADQGFAFTNVNSVAQVAAFSNGSGGSNTFPTVINFGQNGTFNGAVTAQGNADANGIGDFYYAPPSGYKALCTANLPDPAIPLPSANFNTVLYTGNGGTQAVTGVGFAPDLVWIKSRSLAKYNVFTDKLRGVNKELYCPSTAGEYSQSDGLMVFGTDGFTLGADAEYNYNNATQVSWNWKANGSGSQNTDGTINSTATSANQTSGFSIVQYTGNGSSNVSVGHGLNAVPDLVIVKSRTSGSFWVYTTAIDGSFDYLALNTTAGKSNSTLTAPTSTLFYQSEANASIAYCFASKPGFSSIGSYTGNGSTDGPMVNCGFRAAWVLIKKAGNGELSHWRLSDGVRSPSNVTSVMLSPSTNAAEYSESDMDLLSNGFKIRKNDTYANQDGQAFLYMAFAESPFKTATAR